MRKKKILIISDTHKLHKNLDIVLEKELPADCIFHAGDVEGREWEIEFGYGCQTYIVRGNNDFFAKLPSEVEIQMNGHKIFMTHGHADLVTMTLEHLKRKARAKQADIVIFGHTHKPYLEFEKDMVIMNPGSLSYPRQSNRLPSYIVMEIDENGKISAEIRYVEG